MLRKLQRALLGPANPTMCGALSLAGAVVYFFYVFPLQLISRGNFWRFGSGDAPEHYVGFLYFFNDSWRFPLFFTPNLGFPYGANIIFTDSVPLMALVAKLFHPLLSPDFNPFGLWILLCYLLLAHALAKLIYYMGAHSPLAALAGSIFAVSISIFPRLEHEGLSAHFLIVYALVEYFKITNRPGRPHEFVVFRVLLAVSLLVHLYLFAMVASLYACTLATLSIRRDWGIRAHLREIGITGSIVVAIIVISGHLSSSIPFGGVGGFGYYSMNLLSPIVGGLEFEGFRYWIAGAICFVAFGIGYAVWNRNKTRRATAITLRLAAGLVLFLALAWLNHIYVSVDATGGQYEGHNYWGMGLLLLLCFWLPQALKITPALFAKLRQTRSVVLLCGLALLSAFALSTQVYVGHQLVFDVNLPKPLATLAGQFRSSGRFFWPVSYLVMAVALARVVRLKPRWLGAGLAVAAMVLQVIDLRPERNVLNEQASIAPAPERLHDPRWPMIIASHNLILPVPPTQCGGDRRSYADLGRIGGQENVPLASIAAARVPRAAIEYCDRISKELAAEQLRPKTLYVIEEKSSLGTAGENAHCGKLDGITVCTLDLERLGLTPS